MKRLLILNRRYCPNEAWTNRVFAYAKGFAELGVEVIIYYLVTDKNQSRVRINIPNVKIIYLWENDSPIFKRFKLFSLIKNIIRFKNLVEYGDCVYQYGVMDHQLWLVKKLKSRASLFCEVTEHPHFNSNNYIFKNESKNKLLKSLDAFFVISQSLKRHYINEGIPSNKIHIINMLVDTSRFDMLTNKTTEKYIAYCGTISFYKDGVNMLIEAFSIFHKNHKDYKLHIIGPGCDNNVIDKLKELAKINGVEQYITFTGPISFTKIPQELYDARILALARPNNIQSQNGFPTKLGEYLATGKPVVVTNVGEIPLFITDGKNGYLADPNPYSFAEKLSYVADNYGEALEVGLQGKILSENCFNYKTQTKIMYDIMSSCNNDI